MPRRHEVSHGGKKEDHVRLVGRLECIHKARYIPQDLNLVPRDDPHGYKFNGEISKVLTTLECEALIPMSLWDGKPGSTHLPLDLWSKIPQEKKSKKRTAGKGKAKRSVKQEVALIESGNVSDGMDEVEEELEREEEEEVEAVEEADEAAKDTAAKKRKRGRPKKSDGASAEKVDEVNTSKGKRGRGRPRKSIEEGEGNQQKQKKSKKLAAKNARKRKSK